MTEVPKTDPMTRDAPKIGLPTRFFLYTLDQVADLVQVTPVTLKKMLWYDGREVGVQEPARIKCHNVSPPGERPQWRVGEPELVRWLRHKGFRIYHRGWLRD